MLTASSEPATARLYHSILSNCMLLSGSGATSAVNCEKALDYCTCCLAAHKKSVFWSLVSMQDSKVVNRSIWADRYVGRPTLSKCDPHRSNNGACIQLHSNV